MSVEYDLYLKEHRGNVEKAYRWLQENLPDLIPTSNLCDIEHQMCFDHDASKNKPDEYRAYDAYFYGNNRSYQVVQDFNYAWLLHIHRNPHHWQYWVLICDDPDKGESILDMPYVYILEMICDWLSFSLSKGDLTEIFKWYDDHKDYMKLSEKTRKTVEDILDRIREKLESKESKESED